MISARCCLLVAMTVVTVLAQPQGGRRYLPPGQGGQSGGGQRPSAQYGAPQNAAYQTGGGNGGYQSSGGQRPSAQYGAPQNAAYQNGGGNAGYPSGGPNAAYQNGGSNAQNDDLAEPANYEFSYEVQDAESGNDFGHRESRQGDEATGSYHVLLPDGRTQIVDYVANAEGYMPTIRYEGGDDANAQQAGGAYPAAGAPGGGQGGYSRGGPAKYTAASSASQGGYNAGSRSSQGGYNAGSRPSQGGYNAGSRPSQYRSAQQGNQGYRY